MAAETLGINNVVNISSRTVYNHDVPGPYNENDIAIPMNNYAVAKLAVDNLSRLWNKKYEMNIKSLRFAQVFGEGGRNGYMMEVFRKQSNMGETLTVIDSGGKELLYVKDAAKAIMCACKKTNIKGVFNIGNGEFHSNGEIAETFCNVYNNGSKVKYEEAALNNSNKTYMDVSKAKDELGFKVSYSLESAIRDIMEETGK